MTIWKTMKKIKRQILGEENIFGYQTTIVNQLCLMYNVYGKIFSMEKDKIKFSKLAYLSWHYSGLVCAYSCGLLFLQYGNKKDFIFLLYIWFAVCLCTFMSILIPLASYWYTSNIEAMLAQMDKVLSKRKCFTSNVNTKKLLTNDIFLILASGLVYNLVCCIDMVLFYEEEKITNYMYYPFPLPCLEKYGSLTVYMLYTVVVNTAVLLPIVEIWAVLKFFEIWAEVCHQEVVFICENLKEQSKSVIISSKNFSAFSNENMKLHKVKTDMKFNEELKKNVQAFQYITSLINILKKHYESICSLMVIGSFICQLTHAYIFLATDLSLSVKCKEFAIFIFTAVLTFIVCKVGEILDNLTTTMSFGVYGVPWYLLLPPFRKDILTVMCQAQRKVNPKIIKIYPIDVNMFARLMRGVFSTTNVLARLMRK